MAASTRSEFSVDVEGKRSTKGAGKEKRLPNLDNDIITTLWVEEKLIQWKFLQTKVSEKEKKVAEGRHSKHLVKYKKERDELVELVEQMRADLPKLQSIFYGENSNAFDRKDKRRTTTGDMRKENREKPSLRSAESEINQMKSQLEQEMKSKDEALSRLEANNTQLTNQLENERKAKEDALLRLEANNTQLTNQLENERKAKEDALLRLTKSYEEREKELKRKCDELTTELARLEANNTQLTNQLENERKAKEDALLRLTKSYEEREKELNRKCDELTTELARSEKKLKEEERENKAVKYRLEDEKSRTDQELIRLEAKTNQLTNQLENERKDKEDALLRLTKSYEEREKELNKRCDELTTELARSEKKLKEEERTNKAVIYHLEDEKIKTEQELIRLEAKKNQLNSQLENERKAKEDALLRLSSMASNKLRDNNPNIADLSDPNRPTKLSEQFSELYDNEWTDAFDELEKELCNKEEKEIISYLRDFVIEIHSVCSDLSFSKMKTIEEAFVKPSLPSENTKIPTEILKTIKDGIKSMAPKLLEDTRELVLGRLKEKYLEDAVAVCLQHKNVKRYINRCTEVCWYMSVQDPQLVMDGNKSPDDKFDSNKHREYTKKGPYEEFVVWPVLYLYKGGQMLSKGVAQGAKKEMIEQ